MPPGDETASATASARPPTPIVAVAQHRDPGVFSGLEGQDVDEWIKLYEHASANNRWDPMIMLANVIFYLGGTPRVWHQTHDDEITSWDSFKEKLRELFGDPIVRKVSARKALASRVQTSTEPYISYILDVLALCRKADDSMSEADKVAHVLKGIADDAFNLLVFGNVSTIDAIMKECRGIEHAKSCRITPHITRLPNTAATSTCEGRPRQATTCDDVTCIVRRELEASCSPAFSATPPYPPATTIAMIQAVVSQEFENMGLNSVCSTSQLSVPQFSSCPPRPRQSFSPTSGGESRGLFWKTKTGEKSGVLLSYSLKSRFCGDIYKVFIQATVSFRT
ncbi:uncharacterized protein LOC125943317 [Dermacentor silvarum]|uniref:uncharacterized protein LOC125943317 n=1 Tax=Dermacentor silvarum TaxID=543639 RepID=UPI002101D104|nr:uncharacterized protein LOC125943317 [Dermacentor silvarum]